MKDEPKFYSAVVVINTLGQVLLGKRVEDGIWTTPAGGSDPKESPEDTAIRELFEEAGIVARSEFLQKLPSNICRNGKTCHVYLYVVPLGTTATSKLDPDHEVKVWTWYDMENIPNGLQQDTGRLTSVRNAYMKYNGILKSLTASLEKGGKKAEIGEVRLFGGVQHKKVANGEWEPIKDEVKEADSTKTVSMKPTKEDPSGMATYAEQHLTDLKNGVPIRGSKTRSGKPVHTSIDQALSSGYTPEDFREAGNMFYENSLKMTATIEKLKHTGQIPEKVLSGIAKENLKLSKQFISQAVRVEDRKSNVKKSILHVGHNDTAEINTASHSMEVMAATHEGDWLERMYLAMQGYDYGDEPRVISIDAGDLHLVKVDDGIYTGIFKTHETIEGGELIDNAKVRLERMTIPTIVQFCIAKEWIKKEIAEPEPEISEIESLSAKLLEPRSIEIDRSNGLSEYQKDTILQLLNKLIS